MTLTTNQFRVGIVNKHSIQPGTWMPTRDASGLVTNWNTFPTNQWVEIGDSSPGGQLYNARAFTGFRDYWGGDGSIFEVPMVFAAAAWDPVNHFGYLSGGGANYVGDNSIYKLDIARLQWSFGRFPTPNRYLPGYPDFNGLGTPFQGGSFPPGAYQPTVMATDIYGYQGDPYIQDGVLLRQSGANAFRPQAPYNGEYERGMPTARHIWGNWHFATQHNTILHMRNLLFTINLTTGRCTERPIPDFEGSNDAYPLDGTQSISWYDEVSDEYWFNWALPQYGEGKTVKRFHVGTQQFRWPEYYWAHFPTISALFVFRAGRKLIGTRLTETPNDPITTLYEWDMDTHVETARPLTGTYLGGGRAAWIYGAEFYTSIYASSTNRAYILYSSPSGSPALKWHLFELNLSTWEIQPILAAGPAPFQQDVTNWKKVYFYEPQGIIIYIGGKQNLYAYKPTTTVT